MGGSDVDDVADVAEGCERREMFVHSNERK